METFGAILNLIRSTMSADIYVTQKNKTRENKKGGKVTTMFSSVLAFLFDDKNPQKKSFTYLCQNFNICI